jgi:hypothetical protein
VTLAPGAVGPRCPSGARGPVSHSTEAVLVPSVRLNASSLTPISDFYYFYFPSAVLYTTCEHMLQLHNLHSTN